MTACTNCASTGYETATHGWDTFRCTVCGGSGRMTIDVPVYGNPADVDQIETDCLCQPPAPDDADLPDWQDVPELWDQSYPGIDYDATLPARLLA